MNKTEKRQRRKKHIMKTIRKGVSKPRVFVFKSNKHLYAGIADDVNSKVLGSCAVEKGSKEAEKLGLELSKIMKSKKIKEAIFDRSGYRYHGNIALFVDSLRKNGIKI